MNITDILGDLAPVGGGGVLGYVAYVAAQWIRNRRHANARAAQIQVSTIEAEALEAKAGADVEIAREAGAAAVLDRVLDRVDSLEARIDASDARCEELRAKDRAEMDAKIAERDAHCEKRLDALRADLGYVAARQLERGDEDTGLHRIVSRTPTPPEPMEAQPERREIPPPKRGKETP